MIPSIFRHAAAGEWEAAATAAGEAAAIGGRFGDADLFALATHAQGQLLATGGRVAEGLALLDEAMVTLKTSELSPIVAGLVYCGVILACQEVYEVRRAREWTTALSRWCDGQSDLVAFTGRCLVHRAEILQLAGDWDDALLEARRAAERLAAGFNQVAAADALYRQAELRRVRGELAEAERAYREASRLGHEPQPGLALLRLSQGRDEAASAAIHRASRRARSCRCGGRSRPGRSSARRTRRRDRASSSASRAVPSVTTTRPRSSSPPPGARSRDWVPRTIWGASAVGAPARRSPRGTG